MGVRELSTVVGAIQQPYQGAPAHRRIRSVSPDPRRRRRPFSRLVPLLVSFLASLLALEGLCRWRVHRLNQDTLAAAFAKPFEQSEAESATLADIIRPVANDRIAYELRPDLAGVPFKGAPLSTNSRGFRSPELPPEPAPGTVTIVGIGDSIQFGHGVGDGENYLDQLVELLRERAPDVAWRLVNTAVPGYNAVMEVETLERKALAFSPDLVIVGVCGNDYEPPVYVRDVEDVLDPGRSFLVEFVRERLADEEASERRAISHRGTWSEETGAEAPPRYAELYGQGPFEGALDRLRSLADEHDFRVLAFATVDYAAAPEMMASYARRGFPTVHLQPDLERHFEESTGAAFTWDAYPGSDFVVSRHNLHPSVLQHRLAAERLLAELEALGWIDALRERASR